VALILPEVAEETAASGALAAFISRWAPIGVSLASLLFGRRPAEPATGNALGPVVSLLGYPARLISMLVFNVNTALVVIYGALVRAQAWTERRVHAEAIRASGQAFSVLHWAQAAIRGEAVRASGQAFAVLHWAQHAVAAERVRASGQANSVLHWAQAAIAGEAVRASGQANSVLNYARSRIDAEADTRFAQDQAGKVYADTVSTRAAARSSARLSAEAALAVHPTYGAITDDLAQAADEAGAGLPDLKAVLALVPTTAPDTLPAAVGDLAKVNRVMSRALADCVVPNCRNLSKYGRDLHGLGEALGAAGLLAFLAYAVTHPVEAARDTERVAGGLVDGVVHEAENLLGV
jgi:hypothetical protein